MVALTPAENSVSCLENHNELYTTVVLLHKASAVRSVTKRIRQSATCVHGPTPEECSISVNTPAMTSSMFPGDLEDSCRL